MFKSPAPLLNWIRHLNSAAPATLLATCLLSISSNAFAWGAEGHRLIAEQAQQMLNPAARSAVDRLLAAEPGATLVSISTWPDEARSPATARWHYVNFQPEFGCAYAARRDCPGGACVVGAIERQAAILASRRPDASRLKALKYVVHFVGDVHQPLHAGLAADKGGNKYQVRFLGKGSNLHSVWDSQMLRSWPGGIDALRAEVRSAARRTRSTPLSPPALWAEESCRVVNAPGFYPRRHVLDGAYTRQMTPVMAERLAEAAARLAAVLNSALGH